MSERAYTVEYSDWQNTNVSIKLWIGMATVVAIPTFFFEALMKLMAARTLYMTAVLAFVFPMPGFLIYSLPNFFKHRVHFRGLKVLVNGDDITVMDSKKNRTTKFTYSEICMYDKIRYPFTSYWVIRLHISKGRKVSIGNSMKNYSLLEHKLKDLGHVTQNRLEKYAGADIENNF